MSPLEPSNPTAVDSEKCNIAEVQDMTSKQLINMLKDLKGDLNTSIKKSMNTQTVE